MTSRSGQGRHPRGAEQEGGHQDHQQGEAVGVGSNEGGARDRHHEADRAPARPRALRCLRKQEIPVSPMTVGLFWDMFIFILPPPIKHLLPKQPS